MENSPLKPVRSSNSEHGGAGVKFLLVVVVLFCLGHAGFVYVPVAYEAEDYKQRMNELVTNAFALPNSPTSSPEAIKQRLRNYGNDYGIPANAVILVDKAENGAPRAQVKYSREMELLPFGLYRYNYEFNHIAMPNGFLTKQ